MNRAWIRLLACGLLCVLLLSGCAGEPVGDDYALYFRARDLRSAAGEGALQTERWTPPEQDLDTAALAEAMMEALLAGPTQEGLTSPFPRGVTLTAWEQKEGNVLHITLSEQYSGLADISLTLADYCIVLTLSQLQGVDGVEIQSDGYSVNYRSHQLLRPEEAELRFPGATGA